MHTLGIDAGTQSIKVVIYDSDEKRITSESSCPLELASRDGGIREQEASWWIEALKKCFSKLDPDEKRKVSSISVSGQQHGFVPVASDGSVLHPVKLWCDTSTAKECAELTKAYGGEQKLIERLGNPILPGYTASKILHLKKNHPDIYGKMAYVLLPHDYINYYLTGVFCMEYGDASGTGLLRMDDRKWDAELCALISPDLVGKLPPLSPSDGFIGTVKKETAAELGLGDGVRVAKGGGDNMMSAIGTAAVEPGSITISLGTSGTVFGSSHAPAHDAKKRLASFSSSHGPYLPLLCTMNCTVSSEIMRHYMGMDVKAFDALAEKAPAGSEGLFMLPFFNGERTPNFPNGKGAIIGFTPDNVKDANIARATLEGVTYSLLLALDAFREAGVTPSHITLTGGGSKSSFWRKLVADMTGLDVRVPVIGEAAAFGAALQALWAESGKDISDIVSGHVAFNDSMGVAADEDTHERYMELYHVWLAYVDALSGMFS